MSPLSHGDRRPCLKFEESPVRHCAVVRPKVSNRYTLTHWTTYRPSFSRRLHQNNDRATVAYRDYESFVMRQILPTIIHDITLARISSGSLRI